MEIFREEEHYQILCDNVGDLWRQRSLCDVNLIVEDVNGTPKVSVPAHKIVLAASVPYFRAMFTHDMQESSQDEVRLKGVDEVGLKAIIGFVYSGKVDMNESNVQRLLTTANFLGLQNIVEGCARFMARHLSPSNCLEVRSISRLFNLTELVRLSNTYAQENFVHVWKEAEFLNLAVEEVEDFVSDDQLSVDSEEDIYNAVTRWVEHKEGENKVEHVERLYNHVRFPVMDLNFIKNTVLHNSLITSNPATKVMVKDAMEYHDNPASIILFSSPKKTQPRSSMMGVICVVGGVGDAGESLMNVTFFSPHEQQWKPGIKMLQHRSRLAVALFRGELYAIGGCDITESLASVEKYSPTTNKWEMVSALNTPRRSCAAIVTRFGIFVLGGYSGSVFLHSVELYNLELDQWNYQTPMIEARSDLCAVFFDQRIYAIGGVSSSTQLRSVERFDLINKKWEMIADMCTPRANAAAALLGQEIFVSGGQSEKEVINSAEVYNPELNQWESIAARMTDSRVGLTLVSLGNMVYAIGGSNGLHYLNTVECYDPSKMSWVPVTKLPTARFGAAAITFSKRELF